jgi:signal peptide peptidase SppA
MMRGKYKLDNFLAIRSDFDASSMIKGLDSFTMLKDKSESWCEEIEKEYRESMRMGVVNGIGYINVSGVICNCDALWAYFFGACSTPELLSAIADYKEDDNVKTICLLIDSPGGEVSGVPDVYDAVLNCGKPTYTMIGNQCCSAAYWIASATDKIIAKRGSCVGSIGVYVAWDNVSELYAKNGIKTEFFASGELKGTGVPTIETTDVQRAFVQAHVIARFNQFKADILRKREVGLESMNGGFWIAAEALKRGLIDLIV